MVDMDFSENYEIVHRLEIQSEHWAHEQVTLHICIAHFRADGTWRSEAYVFVSGDRNHDTYFVQGIMDGLADHFAARGIKPSSWYFHRRSAQPLQEQI